MKRFHQLVLDQHLQGIGASATSDPRFNRILGALSDFTLTVRADAFTSLAKVDIYLLESPDNTVWSYKPPTPLFTSTLSGATSPAQWVVRNVVPTPSAFISIVASQDYPEPQDVHVRIWVTGLLCGCACDARSPRKRFVAGPR